MQPRPDNPADAPATRAGSSGSPANPVAVLLLHCADQPGLVADVAGFIAGHGGNIVDAEQHTDQATNRFFQRVAFDTSAMDLAPGELAAAFAPVAERAGMTVELHLDGRPARVAIMASRQRHCVLDLLHRWHTGELPMEPAAVIANHDEVADIAGWFGVPFFHLPTAGPDRTAHQLELDELLGGLDVDLVVLARYMQVLPPAWCERWRGRAINIHHSFLPAFAGAQPYHQAHARGVKVIGATAHYVTAELDAGPIIAQGVTEVTHRDSVDDFVRRGRELETTVLARAVAAHLQHRVLIDGDRTVVFS
jgi:formyltetrahydrofolate deformylase